MKITARLIRTLSVGSVATLSLLLAGCSANFNNMESGSGTTASKLTGSLKGRVMGGQFPLTSARVYLYTAPATGIGAGAYGGPATSDIQSTAGVTSGPTGGPYYVVSDATNGSFDISNTFTCSPTDQVYLLVLAGSPGVGAPQNPDSALMAALGNCSTLNGSRNITVNELTTVASVYALQQFMSDATHVSASAGDPQGLANAFATAQLLVNTDIGVPLYSSSTMTFPTAKIYTLGEVLAHCVNSDPTTGSACSDLFTAANTNSATGSIGTTPADTIQAILEIAKNPGVNTTAINNLSGTGTVFGGNNEIGATAPNDFALPIAYLGPNLLQASAVAIDADGNAYVNSCGVACDNRTNIQDVIAKVTPAGVFTTFGTPTVHNPQAIMVDSDSFNVWNTDSAGDVTTPSVPSVDIFTRTGTLSAQAQNPASPGTPFLGQPEGIAYDPVNSVAYVANASLGSLQRITQSGTPGTALTLTGGTSATSLVAPVGVAIDSNGSIVASDQDPNGGGYVVFTPAGGGTYAGVAYKNTTSPISPTAIAFDHSHNLWAVDTSADTVYEIDYTASNTPTAYNIANSAQIRGIFIDGGSQVIVPSCNSNSCGLSGPADAVFILDRNGNLTAANGNGTNAFGLQDPSLGNPVGVAVDESGNLWVTSVNPGAITMFVGLASPVQTPLASAVAASTLGSLP